MIVVDQGEPTVTLSERDYLQTILNERFAATHERIALLAQRTAEEQADLKSQIGEVRHDLVALRTELRLVLVLPERLAAAEARLERLEASVDQMRLTLGRWAGAIAALLVLLQLALRFWTP